MTAEVAFTRKLIEIGKQARDLQDEVTRLRAFMPADVLREYDRRYEEGNRDDDLTRRTSKKKAA